MLQEVTTEKLAAIRWKNLRVLSAENYDRLVIIGHADDGRVYWVNCSIKQEEGLHSMAIRFQNSLYALAANAVRHYHKAIPISDYDFAMIEIVASDDGGFRFDNPIPAAVIPAPVFR